MPPIIANLLKIAFIGLMYLFLWLVSRSIGSHLGGDAGVPVLARRAGGKVAIITSPTQAGVVAEIRGSLVMGRSDEADLVLEDSYASGFHLRFTFEDDQLQVQDLGTTNGTYVNGRRITSSTLLSKGDTVQVGKTIMEVQ
ncbi:MAG: FHA domain-containing protein [Acidimicrobiia bacterium]|nr:FHA domain-containing protein [Acidimicrobiia bacterium]NNL47062.1 FHA domain-containing protein [Acidimicrobiia bacterium]